MTIVAKIPTLLDQLEKIVIILGSVIIIVFPLIIFGYRLELLPIILAAPFLYSIVGSISFIGLAGMLVTVVGLFVNRPISAGLVLTVTLSITPLALIINLLGAGWFDTSGTNDASTDVINPPTYYYAQDLRSPDQNSLEAQTARYLSGMVEPMANISSLRMGVGRLEAFRVARYLVELEGWWVSKSDLHGGRIEAVSTTLLLGFEADIVIRINAIPAADQGSILDMRSSGRDIIEDYGANAARIEDFLIKFQALLIKQQNRLNLKPVRVDTVPAAT